MADPHKTEKPTPRRLEKARREGNFAVSRELVAAAQFLAVVLMTAAWSAPALDRARLAMRFLLAESFRASFDRDRLIYLAGSLVLPVLLPLAGALLLAAVATLAAQLAMTRLGLAAARLQPSFKRLNPIEKLRKLPQQNLPQFLQALILLPLFLYAAWVVTSSRLEEFVMLPWVALETGVANVGAALQDLFWKAAGLFLVVGLIDFARQRRRWMGELRMSKQEIREEMKEIEGNPLIKMKVRRLQREISRRKMMQDVEKATAVLVNPTHYAVAIRYAPTEMAAPRVVAKGKNYLALRIRERARRNQVPIVENPPLARALYQAAKVGQEIPVEFYRAVAEVLAYIYRLMNGRLPGQA